MTEISRQSVLDHNESAYLGLSSFDTPPYCGMLLPSPYTGFTFVSVFMHKIRKCRRMVSMLGPNGEPLTTSYARFILSVFQGSCIPKHLHVDHIDGNSLNDGLANLTTLSQLDNNKKSRIQNGTTRTLLDICCPVCQNVFTKKRNLTSLGGHTSLLSTCSRSCGGKIATSGISDDEKRALFSASILREYRE